MPTPVSRSISCSRFATALVATFALALFTSHAAAQCGEWSAGFAAPTLPSGANPTQPLTSFDAGAGAQLYGMTSSEAVDRVVRWTGTSWEPVLELTTPGYSFWELCTTEDAGVPVLMASYMKFTAPTTSQIWRFDGTTWSQLGGTLAGQVDDVHGCDDGTGSALYAATIGSGYTSGTVTRWNGTTWQQIGPTLSKPVTRVVAFDDGSGPALYASGFDPAIAGGSTVARWNGSAWIGVGTLNSGVNDMRVYNGELFVAVHPPGLTGGVQRWRGGVWQALNTQYTCNDLDEVDFGGGPALTFAGFETGLITTSGAAVTITLLPGISSSYRCVPHAALTGTQLAVTGPYGIVGGAVTSGVAIFDGANWSTFGRGLDRAVNSLAVYDDGAGPRVHASGAFQVSGYGAVGSVQSWDGASWSELGNVSDDYLLRVLDVGAGPQLFGSGRNIQGGGQTGVLLWNGSAWTSIAPLLGGDLYALAACDFGAGLELYAGGSFTTFPYGAGENISHLVSGTWTPLGSGANGIVAALATFDEGGGDRLFAGGAFTAAGGTPTGGVARWDGASWSALGSGITGGVNTLCEYAGELYAGGTLTNAGGVPVTNLARWNGSAWSDVPGSGANGVVLALAVHDDGRGPALYVGGAFDTIGGITAYNLARFDGANWEAVAGGLDGAVHAFASVDDDGDGDAELFAGGAFTSTALLASGHIARLEGCPHYTSFCFGDGSLADHTTPCPCGNNGTAGRGCASGANASGALLGASGSTFADDVVLAGSGFAATAFGIYLQHDAQDDRVFHDGVLCAGGNLLRLRNRTASGGASQFPDSSFAIDATTTLAQRGLVTPGSGALRYYSVFYRSPAATFCPPATANVTNGVRVIW